MTTLDRTRGCLVGLTLGDSLGAPYEGGPVERAAWAVVGRSKHGPRYTDDTQMSLDLIASFLACGGLNQDDMARRFSAGYRWDRGFGPGASRLLKRVRRGTPWQEAARSVYPEGSFGNGAAMRAPALALLCPDAADRDRAARDTAVITHAHPLGIDGARLIAHATRGFLCDASADDILAAAADGMQPELAGKLGLIEGLLAAGEVPAKEISATLGSGITVLTSCPTALYVALRFRAASFESMLQFVINMGGDVDTIAAMAGAMWGAARGAGTLPAVQTEGRAAMEALTEPVFAFARP